MCSDADVQGRKQKKGNNSQKKLWWLKVITEARDAITTQNYQIRLKQAQVRAE